MLSRGWNEMRNRLMALKVTAAAVGVVVAVSAGYLLVCSPSAAANEPLGRNVPRSQLVSIDAINHASYDALLGKYVDEDGYVDYAAWRGSGTDRRALRDYLATLSRASTALPATSEAQLAFWINAYNGTL